jgi:CubicO group peptidase (beta-lactamase class C family)
MPDSISRRLSTYMNDHLGDQYTAAQVSVYHRGRRVVALYLSSVKWHDLASLTKLYTTTALLQQVGAGRVGLHTPVAQVIPEFAAGGARRVVDGGVNPHTRRVEPPDPRFAGKLIDPESVTLWHLLTHTSGLAPWRQLYRAPDQPRPMADALAEIYASPFIAPPGHAVRYSDLGFILLGEAVRRLSGAASIGEAIDRTVQSVHGASGQVFYPPRPIPPATLTHYAPTEYDADWRQRRVWGEVHDENAYGLGGQASHAGLFGTAEALASFGARWCDASVPGIPAELARDAVRMHAQTDDERRGLGWMVRSLGTSSAGQRFGANSYGHTGFVGNTLWIDPDQRLVVACLTNNVYFGRQKTGLLAFRAGLHDLVWEALCTSSA